jgi:hypothetical protein
MNTQDLDQRFLVLGHQTPIGAAWRQVKHAPGEIIYVIVEMPAGAYALLNPKHLREAIQTLPEEQLTAITLGDLLKDDLVQDAFELSQYSKGEVEFLLEDSPRKRVLFQNDGQIAGVLADQEKEAAVVPSYSSRETYEDTSTDHRRHVNVCLLDPEHENKQMPRECSLASASHYILHLNIGPFAEWSVVSNPQIFHSEKLPPSALGHWLEIIVESPAFKVENANPALFLPASGPSEDWNCSLIAPVSVGTAELLINIYFQNVLIQALKMTACISTGDQQSDGYQARVIFSLTDGLTSVNHLPARDANISTVAKLNGIPYLLIKAQSEKLISLQLNDEKMRTAIHAARKGLESVHFDVIGGGPLTKPQKFTKLNQQNGKSFPQFREDICTLAPFGYRLLVSLFGNATDERKQLIQFLQAGPARIQVARTMGSQMIFPWALIYDIPLGSDPGEYHDCQILTEWPSEISKLETGEPADCPYSASHTINTICPFGFWGIRHIIEHPPSVADNGEMHLWIQPKAHPRKMVIGLSTALESKITQDHLQKLKSNLSPCSSIDCITRQELCEGLKQNDLEFLYFYCHGKHGDITPSGNNLAETTYLEIGKGDQIKVEDLSSWSDYYWDASQHWRSDSPLVFINGCHTMDITPDDLVTFVDSLAGANAAGVIGTEITVAQSLASEVAEAFFGQLNQNRTVGEALRTMRLQLLAKGNLLGLAYTPYCCADLRILRPQQD